MDEFRSFEAAAVVELGFIFTTRDNKLFTEVEKVFLMHFTKRVLLEYAERIGSIYTEIETNDGSEEDFYYSDSATESCDPLKCQNQDPSPFH